MKFGAIMRATRERAELTQEELAARLFISQSCVSKYETDRKVPDLPTILQWINATNAKEVFVAFLCGVDGITIMQSIMTLLGG